MEELRLASEAAGSYLCTTGKILEATPCATDQRVARIFTLRDAEQDKRKPEKTFKELMKSTPVTLGIQYQASTSKGKLESKSLELTAYPKFKS